VLPAPGDVAFVDDDDAGTDDDDDDDDDDATDDDDDDATDDDDDDATDDDDAAPECAQHRQCADDEFCLDEKCERIFGRSFNIEIISAQIDQFDPNGNNWDTTNPPDPYATIRLDGVEILRTLTIYNSLSAIWGADVDVSLTSTSLCFTVLDHDLNFDDEMAVGCFDGQEEIVAFVRGGGYSGDLPPNASVFLETDVVPNF